MLDETLDTVTGIDVDDMEDEIQKEVEKVIYVLLDCFRWGIEFHIYPPQNPILLNCTNG